MGVKSYFPTRPFQVRASSLRPDVGQDRFVEYRSLAELRQLVERSFRLRVSIRLVFGSYGSGKTWALSWLWRELATPQGPLKCIVLGIPRIETRGRPERGLVEALLRSLGEDHPELLPLGVASAPGQASRNLISLRDHFANWDDRQILTGGASGSRVPASNEARGFSLARTEDLIQLTLAVLEAIALAGFPRCLILIDELDAPFLLAARKDRIIFSEFFRGIYDILISPDPKGATYPAVQFLLSGTSDLYREFWPEAITKLTGRGSLMSAFIRRTETPFVLKPPTPPELDEIAMREITRTREPPRRGWIPFEQDAISKAWELSTRNLGQFIRLASDMYGLAEAEDAPRITKSHCLRAMKAYEEDGGGASE